MELDVPQVDAYGLIGKVPVRNLWLLMLYASDLYRSGGLGLVGVEEIPDELPDLVGEVLAAAVEQRLHRNLTLGYLQRSAVLTRVRGRILVLDTESRRLLAQGKVACAFEEITADTPRNRLVCGALGAIARRIHRPALAYRCRLLAGHMQLRGVSARLPSRSTVSMQRFGRNDADDERMVAAAKLALDLSLLNEQAGNQRLPMPGRDERWARQLFERAVAGFYSVVLGPQGWKVRPGVRLRWPLDGASPGVSEILPGMVCDVILDQQSSARRVVIDTKFTSMLKDRHYGSSGISSSHLYQIYAYLRSQSGRGDAVADRAQGLLLYPSLGRDHDEWIQVNGHIIRVATVDLTVGAREIRARLLQLIEPCGT